MLLEKREVRKNTACRLFCISRKLSLCRFQERQKKIAENENETLP